MKKLVLALVCMVSVAFFASCQKPVEHPEPTVGFVAEEGYISSDAELTTADTALFIIQANSNTQTNKLLKSFRFVVFYDDERGTVVDTLISDINLNRYEFCVGYIFDEGSYTVSATVIDADGYSDNCSLNIEVENAATELVAEDFQWFRHGSHAAEGLEAYGLQWTSNTKEVFANICPMEGVILYEFDASVWDETVLDTDKNALFAEAIETGLAINKFNKVSAWTAHNDYNYVIGTVMANGEYHLMHITRSTIESSAAGADITIFGQAK